MLRITFDELHEKLTAACLKLGFDPDRASLCARLFAETTCDGVYSHGLNRLSRFISTVRNGAVDPSAAPERVLASGAIERWNGRRGPGNLNAYTCMHRAMALARAHGIGSVALANTNHWMRGGSYGWLAAEAGFFAICWTNTGCNLPAWGSTRGPLGNNPLVLAIPRRSGHVVLDMAMSQFSYGQLAAYAKRGDRLPVPGGYDATGSLTQDAAAIEQSQRPLPVGFWKGSGLSLALDLFAAMLSVGNASYQISSNPLEETGLSQFFLAIDPSSLVSSGELETTADALIDALHAAPRVQAERAPRYPGEETCRIREENLRLGVPVEAAAWAELMSFLDAPDSTL